MNNCNLNDALNTIQALREQFRNDNDANKRFCKDRVYLTYTNSEYVVSMGLIDDKEHEVDMDWSIDVSYSIPKDLRDFARAHANQRILLDENIW